MKSHNEEKVTNLKIGATCYLVPNIECKGYFDFKNNLETILNLVAEGHVKVFLTKNEAKNHTKMYPKESHVVITASVMKSIPIDVAHQTGEHRSHAFHFMAIDLPDDPQLALYNLSKVKENLNNDFNSYKIKFKNKNENFNRLYTLLLCRKTFKNGDVRCLPKPLLFEIYSLAQKNDIKEVIENNVIQNDPQIVQPHAERKKKCSIF